MVSKVIPIQEDADLAWTRSAKGQAGFRKGLRERLSRPGAGLRWQSARSTRMRQESRSSGAIARREFATFLGERQD